VRQERFRFKIKQLINHLNTYLITERNNYITCTCRSPCWTRINKSSSDTMKANEPRGSLAPAATISNSLRNVIACIYTSPHHCYHHHHQQQFAYNTESTDDPICQQNRTTFCVISTSLATAITFCGQKNLFKSFF